MDPSGGGGDIAAARRTRAKPSPGNSGASAMETEVDRISSLPDEILAKILSSVDSSPNAVRTCVLSHRWSALWKLLPELRLPFFPAPATARKFGAAIDGHQVPLRHLQVEGHGKGALPKSLATWLPAAARRVSGCFALLNDAADGREPDEKEVATIELPCFEQATSISICLKLLSSLAMPRPRPGGSDGGCVFSHLTDLRLEYIWFDHPSELGDVVSSARCPCLQALKVSKALGLDVLAIRSTSLLKMELDKLIQLRELTVEAPELKELTVVQCFSYSLKRSESIVVAVAAPELVLLDWKDDMESQRQMHAQISQLHLPRLRSLGSFLLFVYGTDEDGYGAYNREFLEVLQGIQFLENLTLTLAYMEDIENNQYLMEDVKMLPKVTTLRLIVISIGHSFAASLFHILRLCTGIRKLVLEFTAAPGFEEPLTCPPGCHCEHQSNWRSEKLLLVGLEEIEIQGFGRTTRDLDFVERLFGWATALTKATIIFDIIVRKGVAKELCRMFELFSRPEVHIEFRYHDKKKVLYARED